MLSKHAWTVPLKIKSGNEIATVIAKIIRDDGRSEKFANRYGKRILQRKRAKTFEKTQYKLLFNIFHSKGIYR